MGKKIAAGVAGVVVAFVTVWVVQKIGHMVYPPPDIDPSDTGAFAALVATLPIGALLFVIASYFIGTLCGTFVACKVAGAGGFVYALIVGGLMLVATAMNLIMIPHPMWFSVLAVVVILAGAWLGLKLSGGARSEAM